MLMKVAVQIEVRIQIFAGIETQLLEQLGTFFHGQAAAQGLVCEGSEDFGKIPLLDAFVCGIHIGTAAVDQICCGSGQGLCRNGVYWSLENTQLVSTILPRGI